MVFALILTAVLVGGSAGEAHPSQPRDQIVSGHHIPHTPGAAFLLVAVATLVLAWRRRYPVAVLCISTTAVVIYSLLGYVNGAALLAPVVALYTVASRVSIRRAAGWAAGTLVVLMAATAAENPFGPFGGGFVTIPGLVAAASFGGIAVASRRAFVASIQTRADDEARRRIDEERLRIARELHDVVAHTMATINVQAGVAAHVAAERPDAAVDALQAIKLASKEGLRELRAILNVLRQADEPDSTQPAPGLAQLDTLISSAERRPADRLHGHREPAAAAGPGRPGRLPDHPGVADQCHPARRSRHRRRVAGLRWQRAADHRHRHRPRAARRRCRRWRWRARAARDARTRRIGRRHG